MVRVLVGDVLASEAQTLTNTVNCAGVMGKGIALEFKKRFPEMFADYVHRCESGQVRLGEPYVFRTLLPPWVLNFPTKDHWKSASQLKDIVAGLDYLEQHYKEWGIESLAVPPLGCGFGGLEWRVVGPTLYRYLANLDIPVELYAPIGTPATELDETFLKLAHRDDKASSGMAPKVEPAWVALVDIAARRMSGPRLGRVNRELMRNIAYFAGAAGIQTGFHFEIGKYGIYSPELRAAMTKLVNNGVCEEVPQGRAIAIMPGRTFRDAARSFDRELATWMPTIERVEGLLRSLPQRDVSTFALLHFIAERARSEGTMDEEQVISATSRVLDADRSRSGSKRRSDRELMGMLHYLERAGWLAMRSSSGVNKGDHSASV